jgi:hypothetical protein
MEKTENHLRMSVPQQGSWDAIVAGGGMGGVSAAIAAAREGARTLLVERHGRLGGMAINALVVPLMGWVKGHPLVDEILQRLPGVFDQWGSFRLDTETADIDLAEMVLEAGAEILLHGWIEGVDIESNAVRGVRVLTKQGPLDIRAKVVIDATGDGDVAFLAGAPFEQGRDADRLLQPMSILFKVGGVAADAFVAGSEEAAREVMLGERTWHETVKDAQARGELPRHVGVIRLYQSCREGERIVNATQVNHVDGTRAEDLTRAEIEGRRQARAVLSVLRRHAPGYENCFISHFPAVVGVRETRRFLGVDYLTREDIVTGRARSDAIARGVCFPIDIHNPDGDGQAAGDQAEQAKCYDIAYGCLVPRDTDGLLLSGRCISGSHEAHASYRVQKICMATGAAAGVAAALAVQQDKQPRDLDVAAIQQKLGLA